MQEIERRWLVSLKDIKFLTGLNPIFIEQRYLVMDFNKKMQLRIRKEYDMHDNIFDFTMTSKLNSDTLVREEMNIKITEQQFNILSNFSIKTVRKLRYYLNPKLCLDFFYGNGIFILEKEYETLALSSLGINPIANIEFIKEVTEDKTYSNFNLGI